MPEIEEHQEPTFQEYKTSRVVQESSASVADAEEPEAAEAVEQEEPKKKSRGGFQDRIDELTRKNYQATARHNELLEENKRLREAGTKATTEAVKPAVEAADPEPLEDQFSSYAEYVKASVKWGARQVFQEERAKQETQSKQTTQRDRDKEIVATYYQRAAAFTKEHPDFDNVVSKIQIPASEGEEIGADGMSDNARAVQAAIFADDHGPEIAHHIGQHPEICQKLGELPMPRALALIGRISEEFDEAQEEEEKEEPAPKPKKVSAAPEPIQPVRGATKSVAGPIDKLSFQDYKKARLAGRG